MLSRILVLFFALIVFVTPNVRAQSPVALTPPMGWNSWNHFACKVTAADVRHAAEQIASNGMKEAGYVYVNVDDCWEAGRDAQGRIQPNENFGDMKALADYVHSKGLKFGIYSSPGPKTCAGFEGSYQHEEQDAQTYAEWGVDYLKYDWCSASQVYPVSQIKEVYKKMHDAIARTGRPIVFSLCEYGWELVWRWGAGVGGNLWRTTGDIEDTYDSMTRIGFGQAGLEAFAGPGHWNDPDMLEIGNGGMSHEEYVTHMTLWCLLAAPLLAGNDLTRATPRDMAILLNKEAIAVDQDPKGVQGHRVSAEGPLEVWAKPLADGSVAVGFFSRAAAFPVKVNFKDLGLSGSVHVRDLWQYKDLGTFEGEFTAQVPRHGAVLVRIWK
jgi:alpha-galactosidase